MATGAPLITPGIPTNTDEESPVNQRLSLLSRISYAVRVWAFKSFVVLGLGFLRMINAKKMKSIGATYTKRYDVRPMLENRVFIPSSWKAGTQLPLYIDIHGGGFAIADPQTDDHFCHQMAHKHGFCVVSINYRKAPLYPFPDLVHDAAEVAKAVLADPDLPIDRSKVVGGGFSAGGNLILAISQMEGLRGRFRGIAPVYPVVDFSGKYKGPYRTTPEGKPDSLERMSPMFNWSYVTPGQDQRDPLLSPIYASRGKLPDRIFFIGAEYDYLCQEAHIMAKKLAGIEDGDPKADAPSWTQNGIKWRMVRDVQHGFTHVELSGDQEVKRQELCNQLYAEIAQWLKEDVLA